jgi:hypothetical protein
VERGGAGRVITTGAQSTAPIGYDDIAAQNGTTTNPHRDNSPCTATLSPLHPPVSTRHPLLPYVVTMLAEAMNQGRRSDRSRIREDQGQSLNIIHDYMHARARTR